MVFEGNIVNYVNRDNIKQTLETLETIYNMIENKPQISKLPYTTSLMENFTLMTNNNINIII
jgi:hypothetical protein